METADRIIYWICLSLSYKHTVPERTILPISWIRENWEAQIEQYSKIPKSLCKLRKTWKVHLRPTLKNPNFESLDELRKVIHISNIIRYSITSMNWEKCFPSGKMEFWTHVENSALTTEFLALRKTLNIYIDYLMFYPADMLNKNTSSASLHTTVSRWTGS